MHEAPLRAYVIRGNAREQALDWLHVHCEVQGVLEEDDSVTVWIASALPDLPQPGLAVHEIPVAPADLERTGLEDDTAILVAEDVLVRPPWVKRPADFRGIELVVPRGNAFGSGEHASTKAALRCLHRLWEAPVRFGDVGTGSGILALYARARGCTHIEACDVDRHAVSAARALLPGAIVHVGGPETLGPLDCVIANLTAAELTAALPAILARWTRNSVMVLGGMRGHEVAIVQQQVPATVVAAETDLAFTALGFR
ncbi:MAG TPA: 50S ribosomal protein L11 methyltransferase [Planctomycetota bacterium]|nr:50S ribosomal protein L11 methyltransferase [Planctomycetota bacterium]